MKKATGIVAGVLVASGLLSAAAQPSWRDQASNAAGAASIAGVVVADDGAGQPLARAVVTLRGPGMPVGVQTVTDAQGRFAFTSLVPGAFTVTASKPPYLTLSYGQTMPGRGSGLPISLQTGQRVADVRLALPLGSVISGRVTDDRGRAVANAPVLVLQPRVVNGERSLASAGTDWHKTDSRGMYRAWGLLPGEYIVCVYPPADYLAVPQECQPAGAGESVREVSAAEVQWARQQIAGRAAGATGQLLLPEPPPTGRAFGDAPTLYPGASAAAGATIIALGRGEERAGIDVIMSRHPTSRIAVTIVGLDGQPATGAALRFSDGFGTSGRVTPDGRFATAGLRPGVYTLTARLGDATGSLEIRVDGLDQPDLVLHLRPASDSTISLRGRAVFEATTLAPPSNLSGVRVSLAAEKPVGLMTTTAQADGSFAIAGIEPGRYRLQISLAGQPPSGPVWHVKSAMVNGQDASDTFVDLAPGAALPEIVITFTDRPSELSGRLLDASGRPAPGYYVIVFSTDRRYWRQGARRVPPPVRAATDGAFRFANLPPGEYHLAAFVEVSPSDLYDEAFLGQVAPSALSITLADGERKTQDVTIGTAR